MGRPYLQHTSNCNAICLDVCPCVPSRFTVATQRFQKPLIRITYIRNGSQNPYMLSRFFLNQALLEAQGTCQRDVCLSAKQEIFSSERAEVVIHMVDRSLECRRPITPSKQSRLVLLWPRRLTDTTSLQCKPQARSLELRNILYKGFEKNF